MLLLIDVQEHQPIWTARLCRVLNGLPETEASIMYCGHCSDYANIRKRRRAASMPMLLPGFEEGAYQLHKPCKDMQLKKLMRMLKHLEYATMLVSWRDKIPDMRQARGWDLGTWWEIAK